MDYKQLFRGVDYYNETYRHWVMSYRRLRRRGDEYWFHLERLNEDEVKREIIGFLNDWKCRVDRQSTSLLKEALDDLPPYYAVLKDERIESIVFDELKPVESQHLSNSEIIKKTMRHLLGVKPKFGPVPASKLMHMAIPRLFVMWDTEIKRKYRIPIYYAANHARHYLRFLKLMQLQIRHAIDSYARTYEVDSQTITQRIIEKDKGSTLPRILDKYNFAIRDGKAEICDECYSKWV